MSSSVSGVWWGAEGKGVGRIVKKNAVQRQMVDAKENHEVLGEERT